MTGLIVGLSPSSLVAVSLVKGKGKVVSAVSRRCIESKVLAVAATREITCLTRWVWLWTRTWQSMAQIEAMAVHVSDSMRTAGAEIIPRALLLET